MMGKVSLGQKGRVALRRLPPIQWTKTASHPDGQRLPPIQWTGAAPHPDEPRLPPIQLTGLYLPAIRCPQQAQGILRVNARGKERDGRVERPSDDLLQGPGHRNRWKESSQQHGEPTAGGLWGESCTQAPESPTPEDKSSCSGQTNKTPSRTELQQKPKVQKILVDMRAALEDVNEPWGSWDGGSDTCSISEASCTPMSDQHPIEEEGGGRSSIQTAKTNRHSTGKSQAQKQKTLVYELRSPGPPPGTSSTHEEQGSPYSRAGPSPQRRVSQVQLREDGSLASQIKPNAKSPAGFPKIILQPEHWMQRAGRTPQAETAAEAVDRTRPEYFVDFQLPTALLLQRVRDHTSSKHHELIAQVLCSLRQGLGAEPSVSREMKAPAWNQHSKGDKTGWKTKKMALENIQRRLAGSSNQAPAQGIAKFTWQKSSPQAGGGVPPNVPQDLRWKGCSGSSSSFWLMEDAAGETHLDTHEHRAMKS